MAEELLEPKGPVLFLVEDPERMVRQLQGDVTPEPGRLRSGLGADEIFPRWAAFFFEARPGDFCYLGLGCGTSWPVGEGAVRRGGFFASVSGRDRGHGCVRETAPLAEYAAGIRVVLAESFDPDYLRACRQVGLLASTDLSLVSALQEGRPLPFEAFTKGLAPLEAAMVRAGGLLPLFQARLRGEAVPVSPVAPPRPMTLAEKILARHASGGPRPAVQPGDTLFVEADWRFGHDQIGASAARHFREAFGEDAPVPRPEGAPTFADHFAFLVEGAPGPSRSEGTLEVARRRRSALADFCRSHGLRCHSLLPEGGAEGICHGLMTERYALPGQIVAGTDSHAAHIGALGCLAWSVGALELAAAWRTGDLAVKVPETVRVLLRGRLRPGVSARDLALHLQTHPFLKKGGARERVLEFQGETLANLSTDERATLTSLAGTLGAFTGLVAADAVTRAFLRERRRHEPPAEAELRGDPGAIYAHTLEVDCAAVPPMAQPPSGEPRPVEALAAPPGLDHAYVGSCAGGKREDLERVAEVVAWALDRGLKLPLHLSFHVQCATEDVRRHARDHGWISAFEEAGIAVLGPGCGACINAGPGMSTRPDQVVLGTFPRTGAGRGGPGELWLASPATVAASAFAGRLCSFEALRYDQGR